MNTLQQTADVICRFYDNIFLIDALSERKPYTYGEFLGGACCLAEELRKRGIGKGDRVAVLLPNSPEFAMLYFSCLYLGATIVPVNHGLHMREIDSILRNCRASLLVHSTTMSKPLAAHFPEIMEDSSFCITLLSETVSPKTVSEHWSLDGFLPASAGQLELFCEADESDVFMISFSSGTIGQPKGVCHRMASLIESAKLFNEALGFNSCNRFYHVLPMSYMAGFLNMLLCPFFAGASVVLGGAFDSRSILDFWRIPAKHGIDTLWLVPSMLAALVRIDRSTLGQRYAHRRIKYVCVGTAPLSLQLKRSFENKYGVNVYESYGLSETLFVNTNSPNIDYRPGSVGKPLRGVNLRIVRDDGEEVREGEDGEIYIRSPFNMVGYLERRLSSISALVDGEWFPSGDIGHMDSEGHLFITDRKKDLIIRAGENVSPRMIEDIVRQHDGVENVAVIGVPHELYGEEIVAILKLKRDSAWSTVRTEVRSICKENMGAGFVPTRFYYLEEFPVGLTGKIQKRRLREMVLEKSDLLRE